ncbi:hypothetical protein DL763_004302 [Monosporascus cannonballus]|nr:hypothetical protein DL763_004302 [Monosporascus cannonballus]
MLSFRNSLLLSPLALVQGSKYLSSKIDWGYCDDIRNSTVIECGSLRVPLDYTKPASNETLRLQLVKIPAAIQPSLGSIQFNFGGPGMTNRQTLADIASLLQALTGSSYDLVTFDPRGTGNTIPFWCYDNDAEMFTAANEQKLGNATEFMLGRLWALADIGAHMCAERAAETGSLISTAFVARDLMRVAEALEEDGLLRYWGFSYGTTLGATVAAMFPDKGFRNVDRLGQGLFGHLRGVRRGARELRPGAPAQRRSGGGNGTATAEELEQAVWDALETLKRRPLAVGYTVFDYSVLKGLIIEALYGTSGWPALATTLDLVLAGDVAALAEALAEMGHNPWDSDTETIREIQHIVSARLGIHCGERTARAKTFDAVLPAFDRLYAISRIMGDVPAVVNFACAQWRIEARERYGGRFDSVLTRGPVLFIGNTYDALTPLVSARNVSSGFEGSVVLEVNGYGHGSLAVRSLCTLQTTAAYWLNGTLPEPGTVCPSDMPLYSNITWADVILGTTGGDAAASSLARRGAYDVPNMGRIARRGLIY